MNLNKVPVRQWKHREFNGFDPWAENRAVRWSIVVFRIVPAFVVQSTSCDNQTVASGDNNIPKKYAVGIYSEENGRYRILPAKLSAAWRAGQVPDQELPRLLYEGEERLRRKNDQPGPPSGGALLYAVLVGIIGFGMFGYYVWLLTLSP